MTDRVAGSASILIVEDERIVARDLQQTLGDMGYDAFAIASSAEEAVAVAERRRPDVVLLDIRIKGTTDGIQTADMIRQLGPVVVIYLTAHADEGMLDRAKRTEPAGYLIKPVKAPELRTTIEIALHKHDLQRAHDLLHDQIRALAQRLDEVREEERRSFAIVLHDGIAQDLFALKLGVTHFGVMSRRRPDVRKFCGEVALALSQCMEDTRHIANEMRPVGLRYFQVASVLKDHAREFGARANLIITVTEREPFPKLDEAKQLMLFRAAQEALTNVVRHAQATTVDIVLDADGDQVTMAVNDDGIGISEGALDNPRSLGLLGIRERVATLGGGVNIRRRDPKGTAVTVFLPHTASGEGHA